MNADFSLRRVPRWAWVVGGLALIGVPLLIVALGAAALFGLWQWGSAAVDSGKAQLAESVPALSAPLGEAAGSARALAERARALLEGEPSALAQVVAPEAAQAISRVQAEAQALVQAVPTLAQPLQALAGETAASMSEALGAPLQQSGAALAAATAALAAMQLPRSDVGGSDPEDVPRLPGFIRVAYQQTDLGATVVYAGPASLREVADFYQRQLADSGWRVQLLEATPAAERLRFEREGRVLELLVSADGARRSRLQWQQVRA